MNEKTRIERIMQLESMTSGQFAQEIGVQNSTLSHILNNRNNPSLDVIKKILNRFPIINSDWLILGQGPMLRQESQSQSPTLFAFDDESDSLSDDSKDNSIRNTHQDFSSIEKNNMKSPSEVPVKTISQLNESLSSSQQRQVPNSSVSKNLTAEDIVDIQESAFDFKNDTPRYVEKKVTKIILYYSDNSFQEFESK